MNTHHPSGPAQTPAPTSPDAWLELRQLGRPTASINLADELTIGRDVGAPSAEGHLAIGGDTSISRLQAIVMHKPFGWCVQVPTSTNGLFLNGTRLAEGTVHALTRGDELRVGEQTTLVFHSLGADTPDGSRTRAARPAPQLTGAERRVLVCLCLPLMEGDAFTPPASVGEIAARLYVTESAIKQHLGRLFIKFEVHDGPSRRVRLANDVLQRGVIRRADLEDFRLS